MFLRLVDFWVSALGLVWYLVWRYYTGAWLGPGSQTGEDFTENHQEFWLACRIATDLVENTGVHETRRVSTESVKKISENNVYREDEKEAPRKRSNKYLYLPSNFEKIPRIGIENTADEREYDNNVSTYWDEVWKMSKKRFEEG